MVSDKMVSPGVCLGVPDFTMTVNTWSEMRVYVAESAILVNWYEVLPSWLVSNSVMTIILGLVY